MIGVDITEQNLFALFCLGWILEKEGLPKVSDRGLISVIEYELL